MFTHPWVCKETKEKGKSKIKGVESKTRKDISKEPEKERERREEEGRNGEQDEEEATREELMF